MLSKNEIKSIRKLHRKKGRDDQKTFIVEGEKLIAEALESQFEVQSIYTTDTTWFQNANTITLEVSNKDMEQITQLSSPSRFLALVKNNKTILSLSDLAKAKALAADSIRDPGNLGTMIRTADWFGISHLLLFGECVDPFNAKVIQASMGSFFRVAIHQISQDALRKITELNSDYKIIGADLEGESPSILASVDAGMLVIGNESRGISADMKSKLHGSVAISKFGDAESLNAAIAAGILLNAWTSPQN